MIGRVKEIDREANQNPINIVMALHKDLQTLTVNETIVDIKRESHNAIDHNPIERSMKRGNLKQEMK